MFSRAVVELITSRDQSCCALCGREVFGQRGVDWSVHHRRARGMGGSRVRWVNEAGNGVLLHGSGTTGCHGWVESHREVAMRRGLLIARNGVFRADEVPLRHHVHGWCLLDNVGRFQCVEYSG